MKLRKKTRLGYDFSIFETETPTGVEKLGLKLFTEIINNNSCYEHYIFYKSKCSIQNSKNIFTIQIPSKRLWRYVALPKKIKKLKIDVFLSPVSAIPLFAKCITIPYIHECQWRHKSNEKFLFKHRISTWIAALTSKTVFVNSQYTANDLKNELKVFSPKIEVIYPALIVDDKVDDVFKKEELFNKFSIQHDRKYCLFLSTIRPKKNIKFLIDAFADSRLSSFNLILVGRIDYPEFVEYAKKSNAKNIFFVGYQRDCIVKALFKNAECFLYLSTTEGFGLPILESFNNNCPVICSSQGSIPEVAKDAALLINDLNTEEIVKTVTMLSNDSGLNKELIEKGKKRLENFSWEVSYKKVVSCIETIHNKNNKKFCFIPKKAFIAWIKELVRKILIQKYINKYLVRRLTVINKGKIAKYVSRLPIVGELELVNINRKKYRLLANGYDPIANELYWSNGKGTDFEIIILMNKICRKAECFFDIGSNIGFVTLNMCMMPSVKCVYSFEPLDIAFHALNKNILINNITNCIVEQIAVSNSEGYIDFYIPNVRAIPSSASLNPEFYNDSSCKQVRTITLDSYIEVNRIRKVDFIKIDVESKEIDVLKGMVKTLKKHKPFIVCEILEQRYFDEIFCFLKQNNYCISVIQKDGNFKKVVKCYNLNKLHNFFLSHNSSTLI